ncbi:MAG: SDR family NAD(P)-dependent oxidoreductase [Hyphomicrobiaceae bacterium]
MIQGAIVVTGASRGIGAAIALELVNRGFTVGCISRSGSMPASSEPITQQVRDRLIVVACDVTDERALAHALAQLARQAGGIGGLVNNAGIHREARAHELATEDFEAVMNVNTTAVFAACREVYPYLVDRGRGMIVNIGSFFDRLGAKGSVAYCASKAAVAAVTRCLAAEWGRRGITVLNVAPGYILTDINRVYLSDEASGSQVRARSFVKRVGEVSEIARLVAALYVEDIPFLTGETIYVDGGHGISV